MYCNEGVEIYQLAEKLFPLNRSLTGDGVRETFKVLKEYYSDLKIFEVPTGTKVYDWEIPKEWVIKEAYIEDEDKNRIIDFKDNNLHVVGYSAPVDQYVTLDELNKVIYTLPNQPDWIPYVTSYYSERYGFCMSENKRRSLEEGLYHIVIDSQHIHGNLTYGEIVIPGESEEEILFSTYICHPSMANNECSGPSLAIYIAKWISNLKRRKYTYRIIFVPETIGAITYISMNLDSMKKNIIAGYVLSCVGDDRNYSMVETRYGDTLSDSLLSHVLRHKYEKYQHFTYLERGSDERQYNAVGVELPIAEFSRTKFREYPEYHTSADDMSLISPEGFQGSFEVVKECITILENNVTYRTQVLCEPQLGKRGLYPTLSKKNSADNVKNMINLLAYADGTNTLLDISNIINARCVDLIPIADRLKEEDVIMVCPTKMGVTK